ncbi:MAG: proteasome endopeptidase complex, archaeal, alpha subunit [Candidatus Altiarchaeales archaeon A3]|nr:MAG: proteasome endopeptidase complex, archaeal, alpha subunit [Candidatus Altiarchaeales archaeon A3]
MYPQGPSAYDRGITIFSPDGRLFQVEYAREAVRRGTTTIGICFKDGVLLAVDKNIMSKLIVPDSIEKIFMIDNHIAVAVSGLVADARRLVADARLMSQRHHLLYAEPITPFSLTSQICEEKQVYTQWGGARPFGISLLIAGVVNKEWQLFETDPSGAFTRCYASAIGMKKKEVEEIFEKKHEVSMSKDEAMKLALSALNFVADGKTNAENVDMTIIETNVEKIKKEEISEILEGVKKEYKEVKDKETKVKEGKSKEEKK